MKRPRALHGVLFRALLAVILVHLLVAFFLDRVADLGHQVRVVANQQLMARLNAYLALRLLRAARQGRLHALAGLDRANPFEVLAEDGAQPPPPDYRGEIDSREQARQAGWYFDTHQRSLMYFDGERGWRESWQLRLEFEDRNGKGRFDPGLEHIRSLSMKKAAD